jgi:hypothetical protein
MTSYPSTSCAPLQSSCLGGLSVDAQCIRAVAGHPHTLERNDCSSGGSRVAAGERNSRHFHPMTFWRLHSRIRVAVYSTSTSLPRDLRARSNVINFKPATAVKANMYASAQTFGERLGIRERARNSFSISSGSGTKITRSSAQIRSHRLQASAIDFVSTPMICLVVRSLRTVICVNRPKRNRSSPACSNQDLAVSECVCRLHRSASQTLASRKFNVFIDLLIRQVYLWSLGNNQWKLDPLWPRPLCLQDHTSYTEKNQFTNRRTSSRRLFL